jgi:hypothetical protein
VVVAVFFGYAFATIFEVPAKYDGVADRYKKTQAERQSHSSQQNG